MKHDLSSLVQKEVEPVPEIETPEQNTPGDFNIDLVRKVLPSNLGALVTQEFVDILNNVASSQEEAELIRENFLSYTSVLKDGKYKTDDYLNAVKFVSYKLMNFSNKDAYIRTFPHRYKRLVDSGASEKDVSSYVSAYSKNKLVNKILEQSLVPSWVLNQDLYQKAINVQAELMIGAKSELVRMQAANSILTNLQKPKEVGPLVNIDMRENSGLEDLKTTLASLAQQQLRLIDQGVTAKDIAEQRIIEAE